MVQYYELCIMIIVTIDTVLSFFTNFILKIEETI